MKNKIILIVLIILCFIPSAVAYSSYKQTQNAPVDIKTATRISIDDINAKNFTFTKEKEGDEASNLIAFFMQMNSNATKIVALPDSLMAEKCFKVTLSTTTKDEEYSYYFSPDPTTNYFVAPDGTVYHIAEADAKQFITTVYAESIYETSAMPVLTLSGMYAVTPDTAVWQYKNYTGEYVDSDTTALVFEDEENYELEGGFNLDFDVEPDYFNVKLTDSAGNLLFDDVYANLGTLSFNTNTKLNVQVTARWYEDPSRSFCGDMSYSFTSMVTAPAEFYLASDSVVPGYFVAITGVNVTNPDRITMTTDIPDGYIPKFYKDGEYVVALLPVSTKTADGLYTLNFTYGGTTQTTNLYVEAKTYQTSNITVNQNLLSTTRTNATVAAFSKLVEELTANAAEKRYFSGSFIEGAPEGAVLQRGFGRTIIINGDANNNYSNNGVDYSATAGSSVYACHAGVVIYAGSTDYTGNLVVIDHGLGLKTWYYNLGSSSVSVGAEVAQGEVIGTAGSTGFVTVPSGVHISASVGNQFVCPYDIWESSTNVGYVKIYGIEP